MGKPLAPGKSRRADNNLKGHAMSKTLLRAACSALLVAGLLSLTGVSGANAESVMKQCGDEWKAAKAAGTTNGQTWQEFLKTCRTQKEGAAAPAAAPAPAPAAAPAPAPAPTPAAAKPAPKPAPMKPAATATGAGEFTSEAEAKGHCPSDTIVWVNTKSHKFHYAGHKSYGATKQGAYMCEADATAAGNVAAKGEKPKT
jgi:hypothetical protein